MRDVGLVQQHLHAVESGIHAMEGLYDSSEVVTPQEFAAFAAPVLARHEGLIALLHIPSEAAQAAPLVAWSAPTGRVRPSAAALTSALAERPPPSPDKEYVLLPPHTYTAASDELVRLVELGEDKGFIGGIVSLDGVLQAAFRDHVELWTAVELWSSAPDGAVLAQHGTPATGTDERAATLPFGQIELDVVTFPTTSFITATKLRLTEALLVLVGLLFALFFLISQASRQRREAAERLEALQSALPIPWARFDDQLRLVQWNESFAELLELDDPTNWGRSLEAEDRERLQVSFQQALVSDAPLQLEVWRVTKAGQRRSLLAIARTEAGERAKALQVVWIDSTETRHLEEQLARTQKLDAIGQLAGGIAHDFNNALTAITGYSSMLLFSLDPDTPVYGDVEQILAASQRASGLTGRLLTLTHSRQGQHSPLALDELVRQTVKLARSSLGDEIRIELHLASDLPRVLADDIQLEHLLLNLLFNARDAMPKGGVIGVATRYEQLEDSDTDAVVVPGKGGHVLLEVGDTGQGIPPEQIDRSFEPLFTTKESGRGTGLGLSMVKSVVEEHAGGLWCISEVGVGTTMRIALPAVQTQVEPALPTEPQNGSERILVVDDQLSICQLTQRILGDLGYHVKATGNGHEALELAAQERFDLFLLDVLLPETNGAELARELHQLQPQAAVLFMSGFSARILEDHADFGVTHEILAKPFTGTALARKVRTALERNRTIPTTKEP